MVIVVENNKKYFDDKLITLIEIRSNDEMISMLENVPVHCLVDCNQQTLLHHAALHVNPVLVQYLIDRGCDVNAIDTLGYTALHIAVRSFREDVDTIKALLDNGADVNALDKHGCTPLHMFRSECRNKKGLEILKILMERGASLTALDDDGEIALERLFLSGDKEILQILLQYNVDLFAKDAWDRTPLHFLVDNDHSGIIELMEGREFNIDARDFEGETPLFIAISRADLNTVEFLLEHGAEVNIANNCGKTPLYTAVWTSLNETAGKDEQKILELLLHHGADAQSLYFGQPECVTFDFHLPLLQTVLAHLAMIEYQGRAITAFTRSQIDSKLIYREYFANCRQQLEYLKRVTVYESVTLYKLLTENPERIVHYAFNAGFALSFKVTVKTVLGKVDSYYYHALRRRVGKAIQSVDMKLRAAATLYSLTGFHISGHRIIVTEILDHLNVQDFKNLLEQDPEPLSPLNNLFSSE